MRWPQKPEANTAIALAALDAPPDEKTGARLEDVILITEFGHEVTSKWPVDETTEVPLFQLRLGDNLPDHDLEP